MKVTERVLVKGRQAGQGAVVTDWGSGGSTSPVSVYIDSVSSRWKTIGGFIDLIKEARG